MEGAGRVLAIDPGQKRVGLAVSDPLGMFAVGLDTLERSRKEDWIERLATLCKEYHVSTIVLGLPRNMNGTEGPKAIESRQLAEELNARLGLPVELLDERLTSVIAHQTLRSQGIKASRQKGLVDQTAAKLLLQNYLDSTKS